MKNIITLSFLFLSFGLVAQTYTYDFSSYSEPYEDLENSTSVNQNQVWEYPNYTIPIGFDFNLAGEIISTLYLNPDFNNGSVVTEDGELLGEIGAFSILSEEIIDRGNGTSNSQSPISSVLEGSEGNQILKIEFKNAGFYDDSSNSDFVNFQLWLYEGSNKVEYRYGPSSVNNPNSYENTEGPLVNFIFLIDFSEGGGEASLLSPAYLLEGDAANPTAVEVEEINNFEPEPLNGDIPDGTVYSFEPENLSAENHQMLELAVYPNPTHSDIHLLPYEENFKVALYNSLGQKIQRTISAEGSLNLTDLSNGIYFLKVEANGKETIKKIIKE